MIIFANLSIHLAHSSVFFDFNNSYSRFAAISIQGYHLDL
jgi:hypothetical protein